jgi:hypothetical protein
VQRRGPQGLRALAVVAGRAHAVLGRALDEGERGLEVAQAAAHAPELGVELAARAGDVVAVAAVRRAPAERSLHLLADQACRDGKHVVILLNRFNRMLPETVHV